jgi:nicotinate-nucleotide--dimethylbenzimidazole phosphoribosyltransferase
LAALTGDLPTLDRASMTAAADRLRPLGRLGQLAELGAWLAGTRGNASPTLDQVRLIVFAADHGVAAAGVSSMPEPDSTAARRALRSGDALAARLAALTDVEVRVVDVGPDRSGRIDREDGLTAQQVAGALTTGAAAADAAIDEGADLLIAGDVGVGSTTVASALISVLAAAEPVRVVGRSAGIDDDTWMAKVSAIRDARFRAMSRRHDLDDLLAAIGGADVAALAGFLLRAAARRTPVLLDGVVTSAAALIARECDARSQQWWQATVATAEPAQALVLDRLRLQPILTAGVEVGSGAGALLAVPQLRATARLLSD